jgi:hypothetical protein
VDVETLSGDRDMIEMDQGLYIGGGHSTRGTSTELDLGGMDLFQWNVGLGRPRTSPS